ncbi:DUF4835 family protein [Fulvivirga sp. M361]|uniref:type IX secretion system protein PorD n=1 Tax=Fulvivirga sp. M361 TaxID=2594266 RepID=UPI00117A55D3|nr:DUF4835 family protein [Fulvivirga sp. M361]TRX52019.1 DUF4835 family protein [Fulvivirga sp. M361]
MNKLLFITLVFSHLTTFSQELNCRVKVNAEQVQSSDRSLFTDMENAFNQFLNDRQWTDDNFENFEQIKCNIIITLENTQASIGNFEANVQVQSARPVYNTNYESILLNFADRDWQFEYVQSQPLQFNDNTFQANLTSILAFYTYIILGLDYDSFGELGGTEYFQKALDVVNNAQQSNRPGWDALGSTRNRYWLVENLTNSQMIELRKGLYKYHRLALDTYGEDPAKSRKLIIEVLREFRKVWNIYPNSILVIAFLDAKSDELVNLFSEGDLQVRREAYDILSAMDPSKASDYEKIIKSN